MKCRACGKEADGFCGRMKCARWETFKNEPKPEPQSDDAAWAAATICATLAASGL